MGEEMRVESPKKAKCRTLEEEPREKQEEVTTRKGANRGKPAARSVSPNKRNAQAAAEDGQTSPTPSPNTSPKKAQKTDEDGTRDDETRQPKELPPAGGEINSADTSKDEKDELSSEEEEMKEDVDMSVEDDWTASTHATQASPPTATPTATSTATPLVPEATAPRMQTPTAKASKEGKTRINPQAPIPQQTPPPPSHPQHPPKQSPTKPMRNGERQQAPPQKAWDNQGGVTTVERLRQHETRSQTIYKDTPVNATAELMGWYWYCKEHKPAAREGIRPPTEMETKILTAIITGQLELDTTPYFVQQCLTQDQIWKLEGQMALRAGYLRAAVKQNKVTTKLTSGGLLRLVCPLSARDPPQVKSVCDKFAGQVSAAWVMDDNRNVIFKFTSKQKAREWANERMPFRGDIITLMIYDPFGEGRGTFTTYEEQQAMQTRFRVLGVPAHMNTSGVRAFVTNHLGCDTLAVSEAKHEGTNEIDRNSFDVTLNTTAAPSMMKGKTRIICGAISMTICWQQEFKHLPCTWCLHPGHISTNCKTRGSADSSRIVTIPAEALQHTPLPTKQLFTDLNSLWSLEAHQPNPAEVKAKLPMTKPTVTSEQTPQGNGAPSDTTSVPPATRLPSEAPPPAQQGSQPSAYGHGHRIKPHTEAPAQEPTEGTSPPTTPRRAPGQHRGIDQETTTPPRSTPSGTEPKLKGKHGKKGTPKGQATSRAEVECVGSTQTQAENKYKACNMRKQASQWGWRIGTTAAKGFCGYAALYGSRMAQQQVLHAPTDDEEREAIATLIMELRLRVMERPLLANNFADREWYRTATSAHDEQAYKANIVASHLQQTARRLMAGDDQILEPNWMSSGCFYLAASLWEQDICVMQKSPVEEDQWKMTRYQEQNGTVKFSTLSPSDWDQHATVHKEAAWFMQAHHHTQHWLPKPIKDKRPTPKSNSHKAGKKAGNGNGRASRGNTTV
jgi:hypothetical protein